MKKLNVNTVLMDFEGKPLKDPDDNEQTLKSVLLRYLEIAHNMDVKNKTSAYCAGLAIGSGGENCVLEQEQYDTVKSLVDGNQVKDQTGKKIEVFGIVINQQVKKLIDEADEAPATPKVEETEKEEG